MCDNKVYGASTKVITNTVDLFPVVSSGYDVTCFIPTSGKMWSGAECCKDSFLSFTKRNLPSEKLFSNIESENPTSIPLSLYGFTLDKGIYEISVEFDVNTDKKSIQSHVSSLELFLFKNFCSWDSVSKVNAELMSDSNIPRQICNVGVKTLSIEKCTTFLPLVFGYFVPTVPTPMPIDPGFAGLSVPEIDEGEQRDAVQAAGGFSGNFNSDVVIPYAEPEGIIHLPKALFKVVITKTFPIDVGQYP